MSTWRQITLGELEAESGGTIQTGPFGSQLHMSDYSSIGTPVVMPTNIRDLRIDPAGIARISDDHVVRLSRHQMQAGDIVYSRRGDVEKCALVTKQQVGWLCGTGCLLVRVGGPNVDPRFLSYSLSSPSTRAWIVQHAVGATMPNLNTSILREVPVRLPDTRAQLTIAATLGALDDKIESNRRILGTISELVDALAEQVIENNRCRERTLGEVVIMNKLTLRPGKASDELHYVDIASVSAGEVGETNKLTWAAAPSRARRGVSDGDVIYSTVRPGRRAFAQVLDPDPRTVVSTGFAVLSPTPRLGSSMLTSIVGRRTFAEYLESVSHGSAYPAVSVDAMSQFLVNLPNEAVIQDFERRTMPMRRRAQHARGETRLLAELRDALLPELLSGRIKVSEVRETIEDTVDAEVPHG